MTLPEPLKSMCRHTISVEPVSGTSSKGGKAYGDAVTYTARIVGKRQIVKNAEGIDVLSTTTIYVAHDVQIDPKSRVTLPAGSFPSGSSSQPPIQSVSHFPDEISDGLSYTALYL